MNTNPVVVVVVVVVVVAVSVDFCADVGDPAAADVDAVVTVVVLVVVVAGGGGGGGCGGVVVTVVVVLVVEGATGVMGHCWLLLLPLRVFNNLGRGVLSLLFDFFLCVLERR